VLAKLLSENKSLSKNNRFERIWLLAKIDFKKRYYDQGLGILWALINPLFKLLVYYFAFTYIMTSRIPSFALYLFSGIIAWAFFGQATKKGINLLKNKKYLIESIQFEQLDLFISASLSVFFAFLFNLAAYFVIHFLYQVPISLTILYLPILVINMFVLVLGISILLATINIYLRDITHLWDMVLLAGFWLTPIIYQKELILDNYYFLAYINPMFGIIVNLRETVLYGRPPLYDLFFYNIILAIILMVIGVFVYKKFAHKAVEKL